MFFYWFCDILLLNSNKNLTGKKLSNLLSENLEDYLETILELEESEKVARAKDIALKLDIKPGSVTGGLKSLEAKGLINYQPYAYITLTEDGRKIAEDLRNRHDLVKSFLKNILLIDEETADSTACKIEHVIDERSYKKLVCFMNYLSRDSETTKSFLKGFVEYCQIGNNKGRCDSCSECE